MTLDIHSILGPQGLIATRLAGYEHRQPQLDMADAVSRALRSRSHLVVEAGTGVGKSYAYLVPAILQATENEGDEGSRPPVRIVVSTHTISLQEQLIQKDLPFLNSIIPREFAAVLVKGRSNYLSLRRLGTAVERQDSLFPDEDEVTELTQLVDWSRNTGDGSLSDLPHRPSLTVWG